MKEWIGVLTACLVVCTCRGLAYRRVMSMGARPYPSLMPGAPAWRQWASPGRFMQAASNRSPYYVYKNAPGNRFMKPQYSTKFGGFTSGAWRAAPRLPSPAAPLAPAATAAYEFVRPMVTAAPFRIDGPIFTMPAPNLSLSDKPIIVAEPYRSAFSMPMPTLANNKTKLYEVTEKSADPFGFGLSSKFLASPPEPQPFSFAKPQLQTPTSPELLDMFRNQAQQFQLSDAYSLPVLQQPQLLRNSPFLPQLSLQGFNAIMQPSLGTDTNLLQQNVLLKPDASYIRQIANQLYHRFPDAEFLQYPVEVNTPEAQVLIASVQDDKKQIPSQVVVGTVHEDSKQAAGHVNVVRQTDENAVLALMPQIIPLVENTTTQQTTTVTIQNVTNSQEPVTVAILNITQLDVTTPIVGETTQGKEISEATTVQVTDKPIFYPSVGENIESIIAHGFYSALTDARAAEALASVEKPEELAESKTEPSQAASELKPFILANETLVNRTDDTYLKPLPGSPFKKAEPTNSITQSFLHHREGDTKSEKNKEQTVEGTVKEDDDFKEKSILNRKAPLRLYMQSKHEATTSKSKKTDKHKFKPSKSKLTYDEKTGEPVLRIYATSYESSSKTSEEKLPPTKKYKRHESTRHTRGSYPRSSHGGWKSSPVKQLEPVSADSDVNAVTQFGLKLRPRMDEYISIFEE